MINNKLYKDIKQQYIMYRKKLVVLGIVCIMWYVPSMMADPPTNFECEATGYDSIEISWNNYSSQTLIERNTYPYWSMGDGVVIYNDTGNFYNDTNLDDGTTYYYQAWTWNESSQEYSSNVSDYATTLTLPINWLIEQDEYDRGFPIRYIDDTNDWGAGQSFLFNTSNCTMTGVSLLLKEFGSAPFDLVVEVRENSINGTLIYSESFTPSEIGSSWEWIDLSFSYNATESEDYFIVCPAPGNQSNSYGYEWGYHFGDIYENGCFWFYRAPLFGWMSLPNMYDFAFKVKTQE